MNNVNQKLWCLKSVRAPGIVSQKVIHSSNLLVKSFISSLTNAGKFYRDTKFLNAESALLERCIYKMKLKFRSNKGFKALQKIIKSLRMYMIVDMAKILDDFIQINSGNHQITYVPGKCNVELLLIRLQTVAKLMERVIETTKESALYIHSIIQIGHIWKLLIVCFGVISRLRTNAINILKYTCTCYMKIKDFYDNYYDDTSESWIPSEYAFPNDLKEWIGLEWFNQECTERKDTSMFTIDFKNNSFMSENNENGQSESEQEENANALENRLQYENIETSPKKTLPYNLSKQDLEDVGEVVEREVAKNLSRSKKLQNKLKKKQDKSNSNNSKIVGKLTKKKKKIKNLTNKKGKDKI